MALSIFSRKKSRSAAGPKPGMRQPGKREQNLTLFTGGHFSGVVAEKMGLGGREKIIPS